MSKIPKSLSDVIESLETLPGIGPRGASRLAFFLLRAPDQISNNLADSIKNLKSSIKTCANCYNYTENELCFICDDEARDSSLIMVVEEPLDIVAMDNSNVYRGVYHVLGGLISPIRGIGPEEVRIKELIQKLQSINVDEVILATNPTLEGESTAMYVKKEIDKLEKGIKVTRLARGLPTGADLEYADEFTLKRAFEGRDIFE